MDVDIKRRFAAWPMLRGWILTLTVVSVGSATGIAGTFTVTLQAVGTDTKPIANAEVGLFWDVKQKAMNPRNDKPVVTGEDGRAVFQVDDWNSLRPVLVLSADRALGGIAGVSRTNDGQEVTVLLTPTMRVSGKLECKEMNS